MQFTLEWKKRPARLRFELCLRAGVVATSLGSAKLMRAVWMPSSDLDWLRAGVVIILKRMRARYMVSHERLKFPK